MSLQGIAAGPLDAGIHAKTHVLERFCWPWPLLGLEISVSFLCLFTSGNKPLLLVQLFFGPLKPVPGKVGFIIKKKKNQICLDSSGSQLSSEFKNSDAERP